MSNHEEDAISYLRNAWYVAGFSDELLPGQMLARTLLEEPIVFFREPGGGINEDKPMLEAQARRIGEREFWSMKPMLPPGDAGAVRARRKLAALIEAERSIASSS
jgi:hypothetical protein